MMESRGRVLCVDDEPNVVRSLHWLLQKDFEVLTAGGGEEALGLLDAHDFDVLISDQRMPGMTGVEFLRLARQRAPRAVRILLTGYSDLQAIENSVNEGEIFRFVNKPWNISALPHLVEQAVGIARTRPVGALLPAQETGLEAEVADPEPLRPVGDECLLLVDDDPAMRDQLVEAMGGVLRLHWAADLAQAMAMLDALPVAVLVAGTRVGALDATRLIGLVRQRYPLVVAVATATDSDADIVVGLINEGQVYRFVPKPVRSGYLKLVINAALLKHRQLVETPGLAGRYVGEVMADERLASLMRDVEAIKVRTGEPTVSPGLLAISSGADEGAPGGLLGRVGAGVRRLLG